MGKTRRYGGKLAKIILNRNFKYGLLLLLLPFLGLGQSSFSLPKYSARFGYAPGAILKHTKELNTLEAFGTGSYYADFLMQTDESIGWAHTHAYPRIGTSVFVSKYDASSLGHSYAIIPFMENTLPADHKLLGFYYHIGLGLGYQTDIYDSLSNPTNQALTAHVNIAFDFRLGVSFRLAKPVSLLVSSNLLHYSNGATVLPNYGINLAQLNMGLTYHFADRVAVPKTYDKSTKDKNQFVFLFNAGLKQLRQNNQYYGVQNLVAEYNYKLSQGDLLGIGLTLMNDAMYEKYNLWANAYGDGNHEEYSRWSMFNFGPYLNYETLFGDFSAYFQTGIYLFNARKEYTAQIDYGDGPYTHSLRLPDSEIFNKLGFRYRFKGNWMVNLGMKTHMFEAQNLELGIGTYF